MPSSGWVKNWRAIEEWEWYKTPNMAHLFQHLIRKANHAPQHWEGMVIERGQLVCGRLSLSEATGISQQSIRTCLERLKSTNEITIQSTKRFSIITINNYDGYQGGDTEDNHVINQTFNQRSTNDQPTANHKQELKNDKNDKKLSIGEKTESAPFPHHRIGSNPGPMGTELHDKAIGIAVAVNKFRLRHGLKEQPQLLDGTEELLQRVLRTDSQFDISAICKAAETQPVLWQRGLFDLDWLCKRSEAGDYNFLRVLNYKWQTAEEHKTERLR